MASNVEFRHNIFNDFCSHQSCRATQTRPNTWRTHKAQILQWKWRKWSNTMLKTQGKKYQVKSHYYDSMKGWCRKLLIEIHQLLMRAKSALRRECSSPVIRDCSKQLTIVKRWQLRLTVDDDEDVVGGGLSDFQLKNKQVISKALSGVNCFPVVWKGG